MPAAIVSYFGKLWPVKERIVPAGKGINDRNHLHGRGCAPGRP
jgi:hypothetical protein